MGIAKKVISIIAGAALFTGVYASVPGVPGQPRRIPVKERNLENITSADSEFTWSPDRSRIAFVRENEIHVMNADGSNQTRLTYNGWPVDGDPSWSPDGSRIAFTSIRDGNAEIYVMNADGSNQRNLSNHPSYEDWPAWSPDGSRIAFTSRRDGTYQIYVMNPDGSSQRNLSNSRTWDNVPVWSPDGSRIAFSSKRNGKWGVYVMNSDGSGRKSIANKDGHGKWPPWPVSREDINTKRNKLVNTKRNKLVLIIVDSGTYSGVRDEIQRFERDIESDIFFDADAKIIAGNWKDAEDIRDIITTHYGSGNLLGSILVGDIPTAYFKLEHAEMWRDKIISDLYFEDLNRRFHDNDGDGVFEYDVSQDSNHHKKEVWSARIKTPVDGKKGIELLRKYFDRNHEYRMKRLSYSDNAFFFNNMGDSPYISFLDIIFNNYSSLIDHIDVIQGENTKSKDNLRNRLKEHYKLAFIHAHGTPTSNEALDFREIKDIKPNAFFTTIYSCSNGNFNKKNYFAGWYLFSGDSLVVRACSDICSTTPYEILLDQDSIIGEMHKQNYDAIYHLFGDPTLSLGFDKQRKHELD